MHADCRIDQSRFDGLAFCLSNAAYSLTCSSMLSGCRLECEFAKACINGLLDSPAPQTPRYVGVLRTDQFDDINRFARSQIFPETPISIN